MRPFCFLAILTGGPFFAILRPGRQRRYSASPLAGPDEASSKTGPGVGSLFAPDATRLRALSKSHSRGTRRNGPSHPEGLLSSASFACPHTQATITHCTPVIIPWPLIASLFSSQHDQKRQPYPLLLVCVTTYWPTPGPVHAMTKTRNGRTRQSTRAGRKEVAGSE